MGGPPWWRSPVLRSGLHAAGRFSLHTLLPGQWDPAMMCLILGSLFLSPLSRLLGFF